VKANWIKNKSMIFRHWICKKFGHFFSSVDIIIFEIKTDGRNNDMSATITCRCCKEIFVHINSYLANSKEI
jgi:hypothetical protein